MTRATPSAHALPIPKTRSRPLVKRERRQTCAAHLGFVARHRCVVCRAHPVHCHHVRLPETGAAAGRKPSDAWVLPVCHRCHQGQGGIHHVGNEAKWWADKGIDPLALCRELVRRSAAAGFAPAEWAQTDHAPMQPAAPGSEIIL